MQGVNPGFRTTDRVVLTVSNSADSAEFRYGHGWTVVRYFPDIASDDNPFGALLVTTKTEDEAVSLLQSHNPDRGLLRVTASR